ncbi:hypothetical protein QFZ91_007397 [Paraburkholderia sp. JPY419]
MLWRVLASIMCYILRHRKHHIASKRKFYGFFHTEVWSSAIDVAVFQPILVVLSPETDHRNDAKPPRTCNSCRLDMRMLKKSMSRPFFSPVTPPIRRNGGRPELMTTMPRRHELHIRCGSASLCRAFSGLKATRSAADLVGVFSANADARVSTPTCVLTGAHRPFAETGLRTAATEFNECVLSTRFGQSPGCDLRGSSPSTVDIREAKSLACSRPLRTRALTQIRGQSHPAPIAR